MSFDTLYKQAMPTLLVAGVLWLIATTNTMRTEQAVMASELASVKKDVSDFTVSPRFTRNDFDLLISPIAIATSSNTTELKIVVQEFEKLEARVSELEFQNRMAKAEK